MSSRFDDPVENLPAKELKELKELEEALRSEGFEHFGFAKLVQPVSIALYEAWLDKGYQGEMGYLSRHLPEKREPQRLLRNAESAIVVTMNYVPHPAPTLSWPLSAASRIARYAQGQDYHHLIKNRLARVVSKLKLLAPDDEFISFTDSSPVLERDLASRAGLGWVGKNTCLISRQEGSLFFIAEIYTTLKLPIAELPVHDHCGTCTRCLDACPTNALLKPRELDARRCISYLTIESRTLPDEKLRAGIGDWLYGCDICQTVCPWNIKAHGHEKMADQPHASEREALVKDLRFLLTTSNRGLEKAFQGTALMRAGGFGLKRNALVVAGNRGLTELRGEIENFLENDKLKELANWALVQLERG